MLKKNTQLKVAKKLRRLEDRLINYSSSCEISQDSQSDNRLSSYLLTLIPSKKAFTPSKVEGMFPLQGRGLGRGGDLKPSEQRVLPSLEFVGSPQLTNKFFSLPRRDRRVAFTLAEVLITLGIIGVVAAMTIPVLIQKHNNQVVETRLKKIYTIMNQAILMSEAQNGPKELWNFNSPDFWDKYFAQYVKTLKIEQLKNNGYLYDKIYLPDGSLLIKKSEVITVDDEGKETSQVNETQRCNKDYFFYPNAKNFNIDTMASKADGGITFFMFYFDHEDNGYYKHHKGFQPNTLSLNENLSNLYTSGNACKETSNKRFYCTFLIMQNGWKIPKDYPFKVR